MLDLKPRMCLPHNKLLHTPPKQSQLSFMNAIIAKKAATILVAAALITGYLVICNIEKEKLWEAGIG